MRKILAASSAALAVLAFAGRSGSISWAQAKPSVDWSMNATVIEACSCPMFCQCYFNSKPAGHASHAGHAGAATHFCKANNAYKVNRGHYGAAKLDGAKFWISTDLGGDFSKGEMDWAILTFDKATTEQQREGLGVILGHLFPVKWKSFKTAVGSIDKWEFTKDEAVALLDGGKTAEVRLKRPAASANTADPIVIRNLKYWGAPRNDGFVLMPNVVEALRVGPNAFEFKGTNGFMLTLDMTSKDLAASGTGKMN
jgi:hypothetical protein